MKFFFKGVITGMYANPIMQFRVFALTSLAVMLVACGGGGSSSDTPSSPDTSPPQLLSTSPTALATDVPVNTTISATFNEALDAASITPTSFRLDGLSASVSYDAGSLTATLTPDEPLPYATLVTAVMTTDVTDLAGNALALIQSWPFTTETDSVLPAIIARSPAADETDVLIDSVVEVQFSETMNPSNLNTSTFALVLNGGGQVSATVSYDDVTKTASLTPTSSLNYQASYTATLSGAVTDLAGNSLGADAVWMFDTELELTPPQVISTSPANNSTDVARNAIVEVVFDEALAPATVIPINFLINGVQANFVSLRNGGRTVRLGHDQFDYGSTQSVVVTSGVTDLFGNALAKPFGFSFDVLVDVIPPTVTSSAPIDGSRMIARDYQDFSARFSEPMDPTSINSRTVTLREFGSRVNIPGTVSYDPAQRRLSFEPSGLLQLATDLVFTVSALVADESGNTLSQPFSVGIRSVAQHQRLNSLTKSTTRDPMLSFDSAGNGIALWTHASGTGFDLVWSAYTASSNSWSTEQTLFTGHNQSGAASLKIVGNGSDYAAAWRSAEGVQATVFSGGVWQPASLLSTRGSPAQLVTNGRDFALAWSDFSRTSVSVYNSSSNVWSPEEQPAGFRIATLVGRGESGAVGDFILLARVGSRELSSFRYLPASLSWGQAESVFSITEGSLSNITISGSGLDYMASWVHSTNAVTTTPHHIYTSRMSGNSWLAEEKLIELSNSPGTLVLASNGRSVLSARRFLLIYKNGTDLDAHLYANSWSTAADPTGAESATFVRQVTSDGSGFLITWSGPTSTSTPHYANTYSAGNWDAPLLYASGSISSSSASGNVNAYALVWGRSGAKTVLSRTRTGNTWGPQAQVGTADANSPRPVLVRRAGGFATAWNTGTGIGVSMRGNSWSTQTELVQNLHPASVEQAQVARAGNKSVAAWLQTQEGAEWFKLYTSQYNGNTWSKALQMDPGLVSDFTILGGGNLFVVLFVPATNNPFLYARVLNTSTGNWSNRTQIGQTDSFVDFDLAYNGTEFIAAWTRNGDLQVSRFSTSSAWSTPEIVISGISSSSVVGARVVTSGADYQVFGRRGQTLTSRFFSSSLNAWGAEAGVGIGGTTNFSSWTYDVTANDIGWTAIWTTSGIRRRSFEGGAWGTNTIVSSSGSKPQIVSDGIEYLHGYSSSGSTKRLNLANRDNGIWRNLSGPRDLVTFDLSGGAAGYGLATILNTTDGQRLGAASLINGTLGTLSFIDDGVGPVIETAIVSTPSELDHTLLWTQSDGQGAGVQLWGASGM